MILDTLDALAGKLFPVTLNHFGLYALSFDL